MLGEVDLAFSQNLEENIESNNFDITKLYIERDREIALIQIGGLCYKINDPLIPLSMKLN